jgi:arsenate reductase (thioredoxin)
MNATESRPPYRILFLCTGNSARSILAEFLLRREAKGRFEAFSAGARPRGHVNPIAIEVLRDKYGIDASGARSKSWEEYREVSFDFVITVCDRARESCPIWPGRPVVAHWGEEDPDAAAGEDEARRIMLSVAADLERRIRLLCALPFESLDRLRADGGMASIP